MVVYGVFVLVFCEFFVPPSYPAHIMQGSFVCIPPSAPPPFTALLLLI